MAKRDLTATKWTQYNRPSIKHPTNKISHKASQKMHQLIKLKPTF